MTLNQEASGIANTLNQPFNHELKERAKDLIKQELALYIRRSVRDHGIDQTTLISYDAEIVRVPKYNKPIKEKSEEVIIRTKYKVPTPVRFENDSPFTYVGSVDGMVSFPIRNPAEATILYLYSSTGESYSYYLHNGYVVINDKPNHTFKHLYIKIESIFENPEEVLSIYDDIDGQDIQIPIPADLMASIRDKVLQTLGAIPPNDIDVTHTKPTNNG